MTREEVKREIEDKLFLAIEDVSQLIDKVYDSFEDKINRIMYALKTSEEIKAAAVEEKENIKKELAEIAKRLRG